MTSGSWCSSCGARPSMRCHLWWRQRQKHALNFKKSICVERSSRITRSRWRRLTHAAVAPTRSKRLLVGSWVRDRQRLRGVCQEDVTMALSVVLKGLTDGSTVLNQRSKQTQILPWEVVVVRLCITTVTHWKFIFKQWSFLTRFLHRDQIQTAAKPKCMMGEKDYCI